jgi:hypothetical protein
MFWLEEPSSGIKIQKFVTSMYKNDGLWSLTIAFVHMLYKCLYFNA